MAGMDLPLRAIREQIASSVDLIIHAARLEDGTRKIMHISEVRGMKDDTIRLENVFIFKRSSPEADGTFVSTRQRVVPDGNSRDRAEASSAAAGDKQSDLSHAPHAGGDS